MKKIRIMMAEDHHSARQAYLSVLSEESNFQIIGEAPNGFELLKLIEKRVPDIVLVDIEMPVMDGFRTITILKEKYPDIKPIVLSMHNESYYISQLILCGARAYLSKSCSMEELIEAVNKVYTDGFYFSESLSRVIVSSSFKDRKFQENLRHIALSEREIEVLRLVCAEKSNRQIAEQLGIVTETVDYHRRNIYRKTKSSSLIGLIKYAIKNGIMVV
ncbi:MAG: response regulator transcription factor [Bacteroidia bacterium]|nr:response regulator transcription factor [Bacteroidia bacterium]